MFTPATLDAIQDAAHRLIVTLMTLARAVSDVAVGGGTRTFSELAAHALSHRLARLVTLLDRLATQGPRPQPRTRPTPATPRARAASTAPNPLTTEDRRLRTEPGWLLAALPDLAPAVADELALLLDDPAMAALLDADPALRRTLNPLLRSLGLTLPAAPLPDAPPPGVGRMSEAPGTTAAPPPEHQPAPVPTPPPNSRSPDLWTSHAHNIPIS